jgi:type I restriction enzyme, S subunit
MTPVARLGDVLDEVQPGFASGDNLDSGVFQIRMNNLTRAGELTLTERRRVNPGQRQMDKCLLAPGDILFNATNSPELVGKVAHFDGCDEPAVYSNHFLRLRVEAKRLDSRYLTRWLRRKYHQGYFSAKSKQWSNQATFGADRLVELEIPLPPIEEQRRIAAVLDAADELGAKRREALAKLDTLTQAIFLDMFGRSDHTFELAPIGDLVAPGKNNIRTGPFGSQLLHEEFTEEGIAVLGIDNAVSNRFVWGKRRFISAEKYEQLTRFTVRPGDVLVTIMATTGRVAVVPDDIPTAINTKHLCCITLDQSKCLPWYLWAALRFDASVRRQLGATHGAVMPGLNMGKIKQAELPLPPLHLQEQFVQRLNAVELQSSISAASQDELSLLFASLQQRAFRGEL